MNAKPLYDKIVVRRDEAESVTAGGIFLPEIAKRKTRHGRVLAVGNGQVLPNGKVRPLDVSVGDTVYFRGTAGQEIKIDDETLLMLREDEVEAVGRE